MIEPLLNCLKDNDVSIRKSAAEALASLGEERAVRPLLNLLREDPSDTVRSASAMALGKIGDKRAFDSLIQALDDSSNDVGASAAFALGCLKDQRAVEPLSRKLVNLLVVPPHSNSGTGDNGLGTVVEDGIRKKHPDGDKVLKIWPITLLYLAKSVFLAPLLANYNCESRLKGMIRSTSANVSVE